MTMPSQYSQLTMPSQYSQLLPILLILLLLATTHTILAADAEAEHQPITLAGCPDKCGNISIPFPFGMKAGCFLEGFEVICNYSFNPPRAFLPENSSFHLVGDANYSANYTGVNYPEVMNYSYAPVELVDISASNSELRAYGAVRSDCSIGHTSDHLVKLQGTYLGEMKDLKPFLLSPLRNILVGVGWNVRPKMVLGGSIFTTTGYVGTCLSHITNTVVSNGSCSGRGCCEVSLLAESNVTIAYDAFSVTFEPQKLSDDTHGLGHNIPCSYGMVVEGSWYNFSSEDVFGGLALPNKYPRGVPFVVDFAIRNRSCPAEGQLQPPPDYACISGNSSCAKAPSGDGYICKCWDNYDGNPYITNGCQDINECKHPHLNNCSSGSICKNTLGGYECPCKSGMRRNGKEGACTQNFPLPAKVAVGIAASIVLIVLMVMAYELIKLKKFYEQNGGPILKGVKNIRIYTSRQLKKITDNYKNAIGEGHFGKVYMGILEDKQKVAVKKTIKVDKGSKQDFIDEVIIQSGMRHKNIVRLLGCCLEMDVPILMYEYVGNGSLYDVLFKNKDNLPVSTRLRIAIGSAEGLTYMHSSDVENAIRHGDVKSANILLDESFNPKVADFGTSKLLARGKSEKTEWVTGDKGYIDPEYMANGTLTQKSDVYSFGIVLIELITRRAATYDEKRSYVTSFIQACKGKNTRNSIDNDITSEKDIGLIEMVSEVALECLKPIPEERPDMREVENRLLHIIGKSELREQERNYQEKS